MRSIFLYLLKHCFVEIFSFVVVVCKTCFYFFQFHSFQKGKLLKHGLFLFETIFICPKVSILCHDGIPVHLNFLLCQAV